METEQLRKDYNAAKARLAKANWNGIGAIFNEAFRVAARHEGCPLRCKRRVCRNQNLCNAKHMSGGDCGSTGEFSIYLKMINHLDYVFGLIDSAEGEPVQDRREAIILLFEHMIREFVVTDPAYAPKNKQPTRQGRGAA